MFHDYFAQKARAFSQGGIDEVADVMAFPSVVYKGNGLIMLKDHAHAVFLLSHYRGKLQTQGYVQTKAEVTRNMVSAAGHQSRNWITWTHLDARGRPVRKVDTCLYCSGSGQEMKATLMEIIFAEDSAAT